MDDISRRNKMQTTAVCRLCYQEKSVDQFPLENGRVRRNVCWPCRGKRERAQAKLAMLAALGNKCACCGEDNPLFLTLDHVMNDGAKQRESLATHQVYAVAKKEGWPRDKYQVLCMNCNFAKGHYGVCPHKAGRTSKVVMQELVSAARMTGYNYNPLTEAQKAGLALGPRSQRLPTNTTVLEHLLGQLPLEEAINLVKERMEKK